MALFALMLVVFGFTTGEFVIAGVLPDVAAGLSVSVPSAGLLVTAYALGMIVGGPVVTVLAAGSSRRRLVVGLVAVSLLANPGSALAPGYPVLLATRFAAGLVVATFFAVALTTAVGPAPAGREGAAVARVTLGLNLGIVLGAPLGTALGHGFGWRSTFLAVAVLTAVALVLVLRFVPDGRGDQDSSGFGALRVFAGRALLLAIALTAVGNIGVLAVFTYFAPLLTGVSGFAPGAVPVLLLVYGVGAVLGNMLGGRLADRALLASLIVLLGMLAAALLAFWLFGANPLVAAPLVFVLGLLAFAVIPGMQTRVMGAAATGTMLAVAVNASGFQVAAAFAGWLGGRVIDGPLGLAGLGLAGAGLTVLGVLVAGYAHRRDRRRTAAAPV